VCGTHRVHGMPCAWRSSRDWPCLMTGRVGRHDSCGRIGHKDMKSNTSHDHEEVVLEAAIPFWMQDPVL